LFILLLTPVVGMTAPNTDNSLFGPVPQVDTSGRPTAAPTSMVDGSTGTKKGLAAVIDTLKNILDLLIPICIGLALIYFIYGLAQYILESGEASKIAEGRTRMVYGTITMFVIISIWGIVIFLQNSTGAGGVYTATPPDIMK